jgi:hypothetical protein
MNYMEEEEGEGEEGEEEGEEEEEEEERIPPARINRGINESWIQMATTPTPGCRSKRH